MHKPILNPKSAGDKRGRESEERKEKKCQKRNPKEKSEADKNSTKNPNPQIKKKPVFGEAKGEYSIITWAVVVAEGELLLESLWKP